METREPSRGTEDAAEGVEAWRCGPGDDQKVDRRRVAGEQRLEGHRKQKAEGGPHAQGGGDRQAGGTTTDAERRFAARTGGGGVACWRDPGGGGEPMGAARGGRGAKTGDSLPPRHAG